MAKSTLPTFSKVSEWIDATIGISENPKTAYTKEGLAAGRLFFKARLISADQIIRETEKAIGVKGERYTSGRYVECVAWFPKSQVQELKNDKWPNCAPKMFLVPSWLIQAKEKEYIEI